VRVALVSPYSHAYPGGVSYHVEALAEELLARGHGVRLFAPDDPDDGLTRLLHRGLRPRRRSRPDHLVPLGRTVALSANGSRSNLAFGVEAVARLGRELRVGRFDVVHVHEPNAPLASWCAVELAAAPLVGTFHAHSTSHPVNLAAANVVGARRLYNKLRVRIAVSEAARWTAERFYGGRYRVIPNGVEVRADPARESLARDPNVALRLLYLGRAEERKGLRVLLAAFEALRSEGASVRLTVAGADAAAVRSLLLDVRGIELAGVVAEDEKRRLLEEADLLCAPSLGGESFGIVVAEALAAGTPVVCSAIAGYREVVRHGREGLLVSPGAVGELADAIRLVAIDEPRRRGMADAARARGERYAWPRVADEVLAAYRDALALPAPEGRLARAGARLGVRAADAPPPPRPRRLRSPAPLARTGSGRPSAVRRPHGTVGSGASPPGARSAPSQTALAAVPRPPGARSGRRRALAGTGLGALALAGLAVDERSPAHLAAALAAAAPVWLLAALALMVASLLARAGAWHAILRASLPVAATVTGRTAARATAIGVLMSATLPARLGELSRAVVVSHRLGGVRARLPLVAGTIVSQTALNVAALALLGTVVVARTTAFSDTGDRIALATLAPGAALAALMAVTAMLHARCRARIPAGVARRLGARLAELGGGLAVFRSPRLGGPAVALQLLAWGLQLLAGYVVLVAFALEDRLGLGGAAAILLAVNVAGVLPLLPANVGVFQAACIFVLAAYGVGYADALAYGIALQALEVAVAVGLGAPALMHEGMTWRELRGRALAVAALDVRPPPGRPATAR